MDKHKIAYSVNVTAVYSVDSQPAATIVDALNSVLRSVAAEPARWRVSVEQGAFDYYHVLQSTSTMTSREFTCPTPEEAVAAFRKEVLGL